ncbi:VWA domain-containing protein [Paraliomyxa miuraensis]|uniref:VWA domain-containing protein n=1 Tax=Paraliomyxa miuraensis TaxID=376150 RepID=UPI00225B0FAC|nr:VWA domain-containing protein [Paraliomyxa miuraensis]MCX4246051.1 VWA domain-containing protein [Paraliomyxa miuraensis]
MRSVGPIFAFGVLALALGLAAASWTAGGGLRHVIWSRPEWLLAAVVPVLAVVLRAWLAPRAPTLRYSRARSLTRLRGGWAVRLVHLPDGLRLAAALLLVGALARPQSTRGNDRVHHEGIDIVIVLDLSDSMETPDMAPNRLGAAQAVIDDFIRRRPRDRIGLVAFGSTASTVAPLTLDHGVLRTLMRRLRLGVMEGNTTAIGAGLGMALNRLDESDADSKVIVLLTDGVHNADGLDPDTVASEAAERGVSVYTVLIGRHGLDGGSIDPGRLERIASITGGFAYTAVDSQALQGTFQDLLDKLERSRLEGEPVRPELFQLLLWPALVLLLLDVVLRTTRLRRFP